MWEQIKPLLLELYQICSKIVIFFWSGLKWLVKAVVVSAVWLYDTVILYCSLLLDLTTNHRCAVLVILAVLIIGYVIVNHLQKKRSFIHIPWYQTPLVLVVILFPVITTVTGLAVLGGPASVSKVAPVALIEGSGWLATFLGPTGHLGIPTTIWAGALSILFVGVVASLSLRKLVRAKKPAKVGKGENNEKEKLAPAVFANEQTNDVVKKHHY